MGNIWNVRQNRFRLYLGVIQCTRFWCMMIICLIKAIFCSSLSPNFHQERFCLTKKYVMLMLVTPKAYGTVFG